MAEAAISASADLSAELDRIEAAVQAGNTDLTALGFWRLVAAGQARPDAGGSSTRTRSGGSTGRRSGRVARFRMPVWVGNTILLDRGRGRPGAAIVLDRRVVGDARGGPADRRPGRIWAVALHCPAHWFVGYMVSIRFTDYFVGGPPPPRPGLKTRLRAPTCEPTRGAGPGSTPPARSPARSRRSSPWRSGRGSGAPWWSAVALLAIGVIQIVTDITLSVRKSDWKKFRRERRSRRRSSAASPSRRGPTAGRVRRRAYTRHVPPGSSGIPG